MSHNVDLFLLYQHKIFVKKIWEPYWAWVDINLSFAPVMRPDALQTLCLFFYWETPFVFGSFTSIHSFMIICKLKSDILQPLKNE